MKKSRADVTTPNRIPLRRIIPHPLATIFTLDDTTLTGDPCLLQWDVVRPLLRETEAIAWTIFYALSTPDGQDDSAQTKNALAHLAQQLSAVRELFEHSLATSGSSENTGGGGPDDEAL